MAFASSDITYAPLIVWVAVGFGLLVAYRRSASATVLRLAALFLAFWALLATTGLVWVIANGGLSAFSRLVATPLDPFDPRFALLWFYGALGAFVVFLAAFLVSQTVARGLVRLLATRALRWPPRLTAPSTPTRLLAFRSERADAFTFTLLERGEHGWPRRRNVILVSEGLLARLTAEEWEAVVAHELGHIRELDGRYLTFFRTLSRMMRWDPVLALLTASLVRREEYRADVDAVELTRRPRALARALYKAGIAFDRIHPAAPRLLGTGGRRGRRETVERIRRLVALAESGEYPEEPGA